MPLDEDVRVILQLDERHTVDSGEEERGGCPVSIRRARMTAGVDEQRSISLHKKERVVKTARE